YTAARLCGLFPPHPQGALQANASKDEASFLWQLRSASRGDDGSVAAQARTISFPSGIPLAMPIISSRHPYRLGRSRTGLGLFATKPIRKGDFIIKYWGPRLPNKVADDLDNRYLFEINSRWTIDGSPRRNIARYINHSCRPNAETDIVKGEIL